MQKQLSPGTTVVIILIVVVIVVAIGYFAFLKPKKGGDNKSPEAVQSDIQQMQQKMKQMDQKRQQTAPSGAPPIMPSRPPGDS